MRRFFLEIVIFFLIGIVIGIIEFIKNNKKKSEKNINLEKKSRNIKASQDDEKYMFMATLDKNTCLQCGSLDGKVFYKKDAVIGVNAPPMHLGCRCTTIDCFDDINVSLLRRRARDPETGRTYLVPESTTYNTWIKSVTFPTTLDEFDYNHFMALKSMNKHVVGTPYSGRWTLKTDLYKLEKVARDLGLLVEATPIDTVKNFKNSELIGLLRAKGLKTTGKKAELIDRVLSNFTEEDIVKSENYQKMIVLSDYGREVIQRFEQKCEEEELKVFKEACDFFTTGELPEDETMLNYLKESSRFDEFAKILPNVMQQLNKIPENIFASGVYCMITGKSTKHVAILFAKAFDSDVNQNDLIGQIQYVTSYISSYLELHQSGF